MLTINEVHHKINDISNKYNSRMPSIHVNNLVNELNTTKQEIIPHLHQLDKEGIITFHPSLHDIFSLSSKATDENRVEPLLLQNIAPDFDERED